MRNVGRDRNRNIVFRLMGWGGGRKKGGRAVCLHIFDVLDRGIRTYTPLELFYFGIVITVVDNEVVTEGGSRSEDSSVEFGEDPLVHAGAGVFGQHLLVFLKRFGVLDPALGAGLREVLIWGQQKSNLQVAFDQRE